MRWNVVKEDGKAEVWGDQCSRGFQEFPSMGGNSGLGSKAAVCALHIFSLIIRENKISP